jgi:fumarylacetoacetase
VSDLDYTHDPARRSWVSSANGHKDFPIQNLPLGWFSPKGGEARAGVAIGDMILDLKAAAMFLSPEAAAAVAAASGPGLNNLLALGAAPRRALRLAVFDLLAEGTPARLGLLHEASDCVMLMPVDIGDYTDFYAGLYHALNTGRMLRPDTPLVANYKHMPIAYHGRASSVQVSGTPVRRPSGQRKPGNDTVPSFGPSRNLDYELELGIWIGPGNDLGTAVTVGSAARHIAGFCLLNDWSARDIQGWEYQPLGPFLGKSFLTTVSPWIITPEAMAPFRMAQDVRAEGDPEMLDYLFDADDQARGALGVSLEVTITPPGHAPERLSQSHARHLYWTPAQMVAHQTSNGCNLRPGDLLGTGTISGPAPHEAGSLLELSRGGREPVMLACGEMRRFLQDGDTIGFSARATREGFVGIGFGACVGTVHS